jgi:hypothetical protein
MTHDRRYTDHITKTSDHDLLIKLHTKIDGICSAHKETRLAIKSYADRIDVRCEHRLGMINATSDNVIGKSMFRWLFGFLVLALITLYSIAGVNTVSVAKNEIQIGENAKALKQLIERDK